MSAKSQRHVGVMLGVLAGVGLVLAARRADADLVGSRHNLVASSVYPSLASLAGGSACGGCHDAHAPAYTPKRLYDFGNDFLDGRPVVTDPTYIVTTSTGMGEPFKTAPVAGDNNRVHGADGSWSIVDATISSSGLPLVTDPLDPDKAYVSCVTCHDPHHRFPAEGLKRLDWPDLCWMCHRRQ